MSKEILKKVRQIEIRTKNVVNDFFGGDYHSNFKGRGMTFSEVREYVPGDDVRSIDWNVTAVTFQSIDLTSSPGTYSLTSEKVIPLPLKFEW